MTTQTRPYRQTSSELTGRPGSCRSGDRIPTGRNRPKATFKILKAADAKSLPDFVVNSLKKLNTWSC